MYWRQLTPQFFTGLGVGLLVGAMLMGLSNLKPVNQTALSLEAQARKQGMIHEGECRVNWGSSDLSESTGEED